MDPVSNADRLVALLRVKLQERAKSSPSRGLAAKERDGSSAPMDISAVRAMAALEGVDEKQLRRTLVQGLLTDQFGSTFVNDAKFQQVVTRVTETIEDNSETAALLSRLLLELRTSS